jgi:SAM-dependent methyltransferase
MVKNQDLYLPGGDKQFAHLAKQVLLTQKDVLIFGSNSERIAQMFLDAGAKSVSIIVDDYDSLLKSRFVLKDDKGISVRLMESISTDFQNNKFDVVFAQGSVATPSRNKIIKEIKRITKGDGIISIGEITSLKKNAPVFITDIWESGNILPLFVGDVENYYQEKKLNILSLLDLSDTLKEFYTNSKRILDEGINSLSENEKSYYKKILKRMNHESNAYLNLGASEYMGFTSIILKKEF